MNNRVLGLLILLFIIIGVYGITAISILGIFVVFIIICWLKNTLKKFIENYYFNSEDFLKIKISLSKNTKDFNELNEHISDLKNIYINFQSTDYGNAYYYDSSVYNYKKPYIKNFVSDNSIYYCSLSVCRNSKIQPFKYFCKYFDVKINEDTLSLFEEVLNQFSAALKGVEILKKERTNILNSINNKVPYIIKKYFKKELIRKLGLNEICSVTSSYPKYSFVYISAGGNSTMRNDIVFDTNNLEKFIKYLSQIIKFNNSSKGQRVLMTKALREQILKRDNYTCQNCGLSIENEPNLLLEVDHIIPVSKGGLTTEENLQTLCWKCNRHKGNKL